jgi:hypothetical protein
LTAAFPTIVQCSFPASTELATVPAAALRDYAPSAALPNVETSVSFWSRETSTLRAGAFEVAINASFYDVGVRIEVR